MSDIQLLKTDLTCLVHKPCPIFAQHPIPIPAIVQYPPLPNQNVIQAIAQAIAPTLALNPENFDLITQLAQNAISTNPTPAEIDLAVNLAVKINLAASEADQARTIQKWGIFVISSAFVLYEASCLIVGSSYEESGSYATKGLLLATALLVGNFVQKGFENS